ncbi:MAG: sulfatase [Bacteroidota bacterium]
MRLFQFYSLFLFVLLLLQCQSATEESNANKEPISLSPDYDLTLPERPNILWIVAEDLSAYLPMFGDSTIETPNLSRLAAEGVCYDRFFSPAAVCAPARSAIATGMYPTHIKTNHMRTGPWFVDSLDQERIQAYSSMAMPDGLVTYESVPPPEVKMMSEYLRKAGYYCTNNAKRDYQFVSPVTAWDESSQQAHWKNRVDRQPFFAVFNIEVTHESRIWAKQNDSLWIDENADIEVPPYLPDNEVGRRDIRRMYSNVKEMDAQAGAIIAELETAGLMDNTIIFWYTDHGGPLPRQKRLLYDSGIHVPMIVRFPNGQYKMQRDSQLLSFIDLAPTVLSIANVEPPAHMDGKAFLGQYKQDESADYVFAAADRFDGLYDANRASRDDRYKYIRYFMPEKPMLLPVRYREGQPIMQELNRLHEVDSLTPEQALWYRATKPEEELFDIWNDPHELTNLAKDPSHQEKLEELRVACNDWLESIDDNPLQPEAEIIQAMWPDMKQPTTAAPEIAMENGKIKLSSATEGASIGYRFMEVGEQPDFSNWQVYTAPIEPQPGQQLWVRAHRIGYQGVTVSEMME